MKQFKSVLALALVLVMVISCVGTAFAAETSANGLTGKIPVSEIADKTAQTEQSEENLKGFRSPEFVSQNVYRYADDEIVRAIVVLEGAPEADVAANGSTKAIEQRAKLQSEQQTVREAMSGIDYELAYEYTSLLNGFSCDVAYGDLEKIAEIDGVDAVYIANSYEAPVLETAAEKVAVSNYYTGNYDAMNSGYDGTGIIIAVLDTGLLTTHEAFQDADGYCAENGVLSEDDLILAAAPGVYLNGKVPFAYDYADHDTDVTDRNGHGTHVSGIATGCAYDAEEGAYTFVGASPRAQLLSMKIFEDQGGGTTSDIYFYALEDAYRLGADVVNMSIGSQNGFTFDSELETEVFGNIYKRLDRAGVILSVSAGNEGSMADYSMMGYIGPEYPDYGTVGSPATYEGNTSVASIENVAYPSYYITIDGEDFGYVDSSAGDVSPAGLWLDTFAATQTEFVVLSDGEGGISLGAAAAYEGVDVAGKIVVVQRGSLTFQEKVDNAAAAGAIGCIVVNNQPGSISMAIDPFAIPAISVSQNSAEAFLNAESAVVTTSDDKTLISSESGALMSDFSGWGTTPMLTIDPALSSFGGMIYSSVNTGDSDYELYSGTSMAAPNLTGTFANVLTFLAAQYPELSKTERASRAEALLESTALLLTDEDGYLYSVRKQGAGLGNSVVAIDAYNESGYIVDPLQELGDDPDKTGVYSFDVTLVNESSETAHYGDFETYVLIDYVMNISSRPDSTILANTLTSDYLYAGDEGEATVTYTVDGEEVTAFDLKSGESATVTVSITLSEDAKAYLDETFENGAYIEGYVLFNGTAPEICYYKDFVDCVDEWYHEAVDFTVSEELMNGVGDQKFDPKGTMTRAMMVTVLYRMAGSPPVSGPSSFTDVPAGKWYSDAVAWAQDNGIVLGVLADKFAPDDFVTREQIATILWRYEGKPEVTADLESFKDADTISNYAREAMNWAVSAGIFNGDNGNLKPTSYATRAEFACIVMRYLGGEYPSSAAYSTHATFLGFYGDWTQAPVLEEADFRDYLELDYLVATTVADAAGNTFADYGYTALDFMDFYTSPNMGYSYNSKTNKLLYYLGGNLLDSAPYYDEHLSFSTPESDGTYYYADSFALVPYQLRNARHLIMTVSNAETGDVYYVDDTEYLPKAAFDSDYMEWLAYGIFMWNGKDAAGSYVPSGTVAHVQFDAVLPYSNDPEADGTPVEDVWSFDVTVDYTAPVIESVVFDEEAQTLTVTASDEQYLQAIYLTNTYYSTIYDYATFSSDEAGASFTATFDVSALRESGVEEVVVTALDYATNENEELSYLFEVGKEATVTLVTPAGETQIPAVTGDQFQFPGCEEEYENYEFLLWTRTNEETISTDDIWYIDGMYFEGDVMTVTKDETFYALFAAGETVPLEKANYYLTQEMDYSGDWAIVGLDYISGSGFDTQHPYAIGKDLEKVDIAALDDAEIGDWYTEFYTNAEGFRFTFEKTDSGNYTIQNAATGKYLALYGDKLAMVDTVTAEAEWDVHADPESSAASQIFSAADSDMVLVYDDEACEFAVYNDSVPYYVSGSGVPYYPSEWFALWLYKYADTELVLDHYTTQIPVVPEG